MKLKELYEIMKRNNIPEDVRLQSDSGWECSETDIGIIYYNKKQNRLVFLQKEEWQVYNYNEDKNWEKLK